MRASDAPCYPNASSCRHPRLPGRQVACLLLMLAIMSCRLVVPSSAGAQDRTGGQAAQVDSLGRPIFGFFRPIYTTSYNITDQQSAWDQKFKFQNTFGLFNLDSETGFVVRTDPNRTNFRATAGTTTNALRYNLFDRIPVSASLIYSRDGTDDTNDFTRRSTTNGGFDGSYRWKIRRGVDLNLQGGLGLNSRKDEAVYDGTETDVREKGIDYTTGAGIGWNNITPGMTARIDASRNVSSTRSTTLETDPNAPPEDAKRNTKSSFAGNWLWAPTEAFESTLKLTRSSLYDNYILVSRDTTLNGRQEEQTNFSQTISFTARLKNPKLQANEVSLELNSSDNTIERAVEQERSSDRFSQGGSLKLGTLYKKSQIGTSFRLTRDIDSSPIRATGETINRTLEGTFSRPLSATLTSRLLAEASIRSQYFPLDRTNDQDIQKLRAEGTFAWEARSKKFGATAGGRANRTSVVNVDSTQSGSSRNEENYGGTFDFKWQISKRTWLTQLYDLRILLTTFRFKSSNDNLQRTREVRTALTHLLNKAVSLNVNYTYRYQQTGRYGLLDEGGRIFLRSADRYDQDLRLGLGWTAAPWLTFRTDEIFHRDDNITLSSADRTTNRRLELNQSAKISRPLPGKGTLDCTLTFRTRQTSATTTIDEQSQKVVRPREEFLNVNLALTKPF